MINLRSTYPIGIDIHSHNIYAAQLKESPNGLAVRGLAHREVGNEAEKVLDAGDGLVSQLKEMAKSKVFRGKRVVVRVPSQYIHSFPLTFRVGDQESLEEAVLRESEKHLPFPIEEATIDYPSIVPASSGKGDQHKAIIIAAQTDQIRQFLFTLKQAGLSVEALDAGISSLIRLHRYLYEVEADPVMLCHVGLTQTLLAIVTPDRILVHRGVPWGVEILLTKLGENLELSEVQSKAVLREYGLIHKDRQNLDQGKGLADKDNMLRAISQIITPRLEALIYEFHNVIGYVMSEERDVVVTAVYVYGQANLIRDLDHYLESTLNIPTKIVDPMTKVALPEECILSDGSEGAPFSLALGLAMRQVPWL